MAAVVFVHGFLSSPISGNARIIKNWLSANRPDVEYYCPALPPYPEQAITHLITLIEKLRTPLREIFLIGSSMGGFWATYLTEKYDLKAALLNPVTDPTRLMPQYMGRDLVNVHTGEIYRYEESHIAQMKRLEVQPIRRGGNYFLLVNSGDEILDYRDAVRKYRGCKKVILEGGAHGDRVSHGLQSWVPEIMAFFEQRRPSRS